MITGAAPLSLDRRPLQARSLMGHPDHSNRSRSPIAPQGKPTSLMRVTLLGDPPVDLVHRLRDGLVRSVEQLSTPSGITSVPSGPTVPGHLGPALVGDGVGPVTGVEGVFPVPCSQPIKASTAGASHRPGSRSARRTRRTSSATSTRQTAMPCRQKLPSQL